MRNHLIVLFPFLLLGCIGGERRLVDRTQYSLDASELDALVFDVGAGRLDIVGDPDIDTVEVTVELATNLYAFDDDDGAIDALDVTLDERDDAAELFVHIDDGPAGYYADVVVSVPARMMVDGVDESGHACISDVAGVRLDDDSGGITLTRIDGDVVLRDGSGDIDVFGVDGDVEIDDASGDIALESINGAVSIADGSGDIHAEGVVGGVTVDDASGDVTLLEVLGDVRVTDGSGDITVETDGEFVLEDDGSGEVYEL